MPYRSSGTEVVQPYPPLDHRDGVQVCVQLEVVDERCLAELGASALIDGWAASCASPDAAKRRV